MGDELMTVADLAEYLDLSAHTIYQWRYRGTGPIGFKVGGRVRYRRRDIDRWLEAQRDVEAVDAVGA